LVEKLKLADAVVFADPVYFRDLSESMRGFLDRLRRISYEQTEHALKGKPAIGVCMAGGGGRGAPSACFNLINILQTIGFDVVDIMPVRRQNIDIKVPKLEMTGERLATRPDTNPSTYSLLLGKVARRMVAMFIIVYLGYYRLSRWRRKRV
jgi:NAD(P)H-dependent FMN reductase